MDTKLKKRFALTKKHMWEDTQHNINMNVPKNEYYTLVVKILAFWMRAFREKAHITRYIRPKSWTEAKDYYYSQSIKKSDEHFIA